MAPIYISATQARQDFFDILKKVYQKGEEMIIKLHNKPVAKLVKSQKQPLGINLKPVLKLKKRMSEEEFMQIVEEAKESI